MLQILELAPLSQGWAIGPLKIGIREGNKEERFWRLANPLRS
jgi:hypothetical protein